MSRSDAGLAAAGLGPGLTVVEASAGTGKTHRVTTLAARAVAGGLDLDEVLLVTFTRAATGELRDRVWRRLVAVESQLAAHLATGAAPTDDVARQITEGTLPGPAETVEVRHRRVAAAVARFDAATIATIHGFCEQVLSRVGFAGDVERDVDFIEDPRALTEQVVDDLLVQRFHKKVAFHLGRDAALAIAHAVITDPHARIVPDRDDPDGAAAMRSRFATAVRDRLDRRKRELRVLGYDDLLTRLALTLQGPQGDLVRRRLQRDHRLVIVDEFQDTDAVQWEILRLGFLGGDTALVVVGDPKQAIYAFRGADVHAYLAARDTAGEATEAMTTSYRSDAALLRGLDEIFAGATLGHPDIAHRTVHAADHLVEPRLVGGRRSAPVRIRHVRRDVPDAALTDKRGDLKAPWARSFVARDLATEIVQQLDPATGPQIVERALDGTEAAPRPVVPGDIAVLVPRHADASLVRDALADAGVPTVVNGAGSVFDTRAASDWLALLEAIEQPAATTRVRSAALTAFFGWRAEQVDAADDGEWDHVHDALHDWRRALVHRGVAAMFELACASTALPARLLGTEGGERELTDLRHVAELLHDHGQHDDTTPAALVAWLRERRRDPGREQDADAQSRRLETDADAVQVWTIHRSKGLEFPLVHVPFLWRPAWIPDDDIPVFHDPLDGRRCIDVGGPRTGFSANVARSVQERRGEELRLAYVALTRAAHQVVLWWASTYNAFESPLGQLVFGPHAGGDLQRTPGDDEARSILDGLAQRSAGAIVVEQSSGGDGRTWDRAVDDAPSLSTSTFGRDLDLRWRRTSYSALTALAHEHGPDATEDPTVAPEHDERGIEDERMTDTGISTGSADGSADDRAAEEQRLRAVASVFGDTGGGTRFGTMVHSVLEDVDFASTDLTGDLRRSLVRRMDGAWVDVDAAAVVAGLAAAIETPMGPIVDDLRLRDVERRDRLDELHFELPLVGGDEPDGVLTMSTIAEVVRTTLPADDVLAGYHEHLVHPDLDQTVRGYLSGSIDVVLRTPTGRFVVVDHKSNWLGAEGEELSAWHYRPEALRDAMVRAHYPLQSMLYGVALHRYLRWRLPDYRPEDHLGGSVYLFVRGMTGGDVPRVGGLPCGVFAWNPPSTLVTGLSDALDRGDR